MKAKIITKDEAFLFWNKSSCLITIDNFEDGTFYFVSSHGIPEGMNKNKWVPVTMYGKEFFVVQRDGIEDGVIDTIEKFFVLNSSKYIGE